MAKAGIIVARIVIILIGAGLTVWWIIADPGWQAVFSNSAVIISFIPIPGVAFGFLIQCVPLIGGIVIAANIGK